ncbi:MAG: Crp/Fnr family transcriptional regulator [Chitinophagales bacterium]|nr:Crp/Fnr family transcriptional regulator [Bacteroidota bacterium]
MFEEKNVTNYLAEMAQKSIIQREKLARKELEEYLVSVGKCTNAEMEELMQHFEFVSANKNQIIIDKDEVIEHFYYIYEGIVKIYYYYNEKQVIERFENEKGFFGGNFSHLTKVKGTHVYEAVENTSLLRIRQADLEILCQKSHNIEHTYRVSLENFHANFVRRLTYFKSFNAEEKYREFVQNYGDILNRVNLKDVANYLDITPETLSRVRANFDKR